MIFWIIGIGILGFTSSIVGGILIYRDRLETHKKLIQLVEQEKKSLDETLSQIDKLELLKTNAGRELLKVFSLYENDNHEIFKSQVHKGYTISEIKSQLNELESQKQKLEEAKLKAGQRLKMSLWGVGAGVILLPVYWSGVPVLLIAGIMALYFYIKQSTYQDKLENLESEIHKMEISMA